MTEELWGTLHYLAHGGQNIHTIMKHTSTILPLPPIVLAQSCYFLTQPYGIGLIPSVV